MLRTIFAFLTLLFTPCLFAQVSFVGQTSFSSFGSSGVVTATKPANLPPFVSAFIAQNANQYTWADGVPCWFSNSETFVITATGSYDVTLYARDDDSSARVETIEMGTSVQQISNFHAGTYLTYTVTGSVAFTITANAGANAVLTSVFFDPPPGVVPPVTGTTTPTCPTPKATLFWTASAGATGYNVYENSVKITSSPVTSLSYVISGLTTGTYSFQVSTLDAQGESMLSPVLTVTVP